MISPTNTSTDVILYDAGRWKANICPNDADVRSAWFPSFRGRRCSTLDGCGIEVFLARPRTGQILVEYSTLEDVDVNVSIVFNFRLQAVYFISELSSHPHNLLTETKQLPRKQPSMVRPSILFFLLQNTQLQLTTISNSPSSPRLRIPPHSVPGGRLRMAPQNVHHHDPFLGQSLLDRLCACVQYRTVGLVGSSSRA